MVLFGHPHVPSERFYHIESIEAVRHTPANSVVALFFSPANLDIIRYLKDNGVRFALFVDNQGDAVIAENLRASYLIVNPKAGSAIRASPNITCSTPKYSATSMIPKGSKN